MYLSIDFKGSWPLTPSPACVVGPPHSPAHRSSPLLGELPLVNPSISHQHWDWIVGAACQRSCQAKGGIFLLCPLCYYTTPSSLPFFLGATGLLGNLFLVGHSVWVLCCTWGYIAVITLEEHCWWTHTGESMGLWTLARPWNSCSLDKARLH